MLEAVHHLFIVKINVNLKYAKIEFIAYYKDISLKKIQLEIIFEERKCKTPQYN